MNQPTIRYFERNGMCEGCGIRKGVGKAFASHQGRYINMFPACESCLEIDLAVTEAKVNGWRFTEIGTSLSDESTGYCERRCLCGAVSILSLGGVHCVPCWRTERMIGKKMKESKEILGLLVALRREIREMKNRCIVLTT